MNRKYSAGIAYIAGWCAIVSGIVAVIGIVFLITMFIGFSTDNLSLQRYGTLNDICIIIQYLLALPVALALHQRFKDDALVLSRAATGIGIVGMIAVVVFQYLLVARVLTFEDQVGLAINALLVVGVWLFITGYLWGRLTGKRALSLLMSVLALIYLGYPVWAFWVGRQLISRNMQQAEQHLSTRGENA